MKKTLILMTILFTTALLLMACSDDNRNGSSGKTVGNQTENEDQKDSQTDKKGNESESTAESKESTADDSNETSSVETRNKESTNTYKNDGDNSLFGYSSNEIEYARVWLQLGPNQNLDELNVRYISAGEPLNPDDATSANYPEDVIQLAGSRLVDGSVTYSVNGDGTINVYNVPLRWDGKYPAGEKFYTDIIQNTKLIPIDPGGDKDIIELIKMLNIHS